MGWTGHLRGAVHMCSMGVRHSRMSRSQVIDNDLNPKWNEDFKLLVHEPEHQVALPPLDTTTTYNTGHTAHKLQPHCIRDRQQQ